ncbi:MAG: hypothetical protein OXE98_06785 [Hyphomicrobiales bacterium]|nr:hypothetical protein [Hyphomicrobiales bacterium]
MSTGQMIVGVATIVFTVIATVVGGTWVILEEINESHVELQKQINESRVEFHKETGEVRVEIREENAKTREEVGGLRGDVANVGSKFDEFEDSHRREHDLFYGQGGQ